MMVKRLNKKSVILRLRVALSGSRPRIWRTIEAPGDLTLGMLHYTLQFVMGWWNCHMHEFIIDKERYGEKSSHAFEMYDEVEDEDKVRIGNVLSGVKKFLYVYDFGDNWVHEITVQAIGAPKVGELYPRCVSGKMNCPPEDCGGLYGFYEMLEALEDPKHPEYEGYREWLDGDYDPQCFDLEIANDVLTQLPVRYCLPKSK